MSNWMKVSQAAHRCGCAASPIYRWVKDGRIHSTLSPQGELVDLDEVRNVVNSYQNPAPEGWVTGYEFARETNMKSRTVRKFLLRRNVPSQMRQGPHGKTLIYPLKEAMEAYREHCWWVRNHKQVAHDKHLAYQRAKYHALKQHKLHQATIPQEEPHTAVNKPYVHLWERDTHDDPIAFDGQRWRAHE